MSKCCINTHTNSHTHKDKQLTAEHKEMLHTHTHTLSLPLCTKKVTLKSIRLLMASSSFYIITYYMHNQLVSNNVISQNLKIKYRQLESDSLLLSAVAA